MMFEGIFNYFIKPRVQNAVERIIIKALDEELPALIKEITAKSFEKNPNRELSSVGWYWALAWALQRHWKDVDDATCVKWLTEYHGVRYGANGYTWTATDAKILADQYAAEFGEKP